MANEFYTLTTLSTLAGATGATVAITNALKTAFDLSPKWLGLVVAEVICVGVLSATGAAHVSDWLIAVLNGCLVYATAAGATSAGHAAGVRGPDIPDTPGTASSDGNVPADVQPGRNRKRTFWSPWF